MSGKGDDDCEREPRYAHLLQPIRDLAANWAVDVAQELESYLAELSLAPIPEDSHGSFNFAEAALLIQGSIQIYSRKVEYLYALVLQALEVIAQKKQGQEKSSSIQENGKDVDIVEDKEEDFLNLDDVPEEANIDIVDEENGPGSFTPAVKPPACLLVVEGHNPELSGEAGELASYQISTSSLHRDFLLLDPCDAKVVDEYWRAKELKQKNVTPSNPPSSAHRRTPRSGAGTPNRRLSTAQDTNNFGSCQRNHSTVKSPEMAEMYDGGVDDWHDDTGGAETWGEGGNGDGLDGKDGNNRYTHNDQNQVDEGDDAVDPWAPLNPHEPGMLPVMPYRRGRLNSRKRGMKKSRDPCLDATSNRPELSKVWQALECLEREIRQSKQAESPPPYEKLRSTFISGGSIAFDDEESDDSSDSESDSGPGGWDAADEPVVYEPDFVEDYGSQDPSQQSKHDMGLGEPEISAKPADKGACLEDLCQVHLDEFLKKHTESEVRAELATRVTSWKQKIEKNLAVQDSHPPFDIHAYGERVLCKLTVSPDAMDECVIEKSFVDIVAGLERHEVARTFAALLQLVNNGNVSLEKGHADCLPICFTAEHSFSVRLLSSRKAHEEMLHYRAPSAMNSARKSSRKGKRVPSKLSSMEVEGENVVSSFLFSGVHSPAAANTPHKLMSSGKSKRMAKGRIGEPEGEAEVGMPNKNLSPKSTPEGKRRRRRQSLKPVQVLLAG